MCASLVELRWQELLFSPFGFCGPAEEAPFRTAIGRSKGRETLTKAFTIVAQRHQQASRRLAHASEQRLGGASPVRVFTTASSGEAAIRPPLLFCAFER
jgi:hypothetical protein